MEAIKRRAVELDLIFESPNATLRRVFQLDVDESEDEEIEVDDEEEVMDMEPGREVSYFLTIHQPLPTDRPRDDDDNGIWVNRKSEFRHWVTEIRQDDIVFVYEVKSTKRPGFVEDNSQLKPCHEPRGGLVSCFRVDGEFIPGDQQTYEGNKYIGGYWGENLSREYVELDTLKEEWQNATGEEFNPRTPGGIRLLSKEQYRCLARLMGVQI